MAEESRQKQDKKRTDWRVLAGLGLLALIAISLLLIEEEYPSSPQPKPPSLSVADQQQPPQVAVPEVGKEPQKQPSLPLESTPGVPDDDAQQPAAESQAPETAADAQSKALEPPPSVEPPAVSPTAPKETETAPVDESAEEPKEAPELEALPSPSGEPSPSLDMPPSPQAPQPAAPQATADMPAPEALSKKEAEPAGPARQADMQQQAEPHRAAAPAGASARSLVTGDEVPDLVCRFAFDADTLSALEQQKLHEFLQRLGPDVAGLRLEGHADSIGPERYNLGLSKNRAAYVAALTAAITGFDASRIQTKGWGESRPAVANISPTHRAENRRVAVFVTPGPAPATLAQQQLGPLRQSPPVSKTPPKKGETLPLAGQAKAGQTALSRPLAADVEAGLQPVPRPRAEAPQEDFEPAATLVRRESQDFSGSYFSLREQGPAHVLNFDFDSAYVSQSAASDLLQPLSSLPQGATLTLAAHTDSVGSQAYNLDLAQRRALAVGAVLVRELDEPPPIRILLLSKDFPLCPPPKGGAVPLRCNRRVEVYIQQESSEKASRDAAGVSVSGPLGSSITLNNTFAKTAGKLHNPLALTGAGV